MKRIETVKASLFRYRMLLYIADDGPWTDAEIVTDTPVAVGHEIYWNYNPKHPKCEMHIVVNAISHDSKGTTIYCDYDDIFDDKSLARICRTHFGMQRERADEMPRCVREWREEQRQANNERSGSSSAGATGSGGSDHG